MGEGAEKPGTEANAGRLDTQGPRISIAMNQPPAPRHKWVPAVAVAGAAALTVAVALAGKAGHDYVQFHAAAQLLRAGENPYGFDAQARAQHALRDSDGPYTPNANDPYKDIGILPYFYPPWLALACVPLTALCYPWARAVWVSFGALCLAASGYGLARLNGVAPSRVAAPVTVALALGLMPCLCCIRLGQTPPLVLAGLVAALLLLRHGRDRSAGAALAWAVVKPQLAVVAVPAALFWAARRGRWGVLAGFAATLGILGFVSALFLPDWPLEVIRAPSLLPVPTAVDASVGVTWISVLRTLGASGAWLAAGYAFAALPAAFVAFRAAWDRSRDAADADAVGLGLLAAFFVSPYALGYDLAVLVVPLALLLPRLPPRGLASALAVAVLVPYWQLSALNAGLWQVTFFAWPLALAGLWAARGRSTGNAATDVVVSS
jgi:hypothetical protein